MSGETLSRSDVSYGKLVELQERLLSATRAGTVSWDDDGMGHSFQWSGAHGSVTLTPDSFAVYDDRGRQLRKFKPDTDDLYQVVHERRAANSREVIERLMAELESM